MDCRWHVKLDVCRIRTFFGPLRSLLRRLTLRWPLVVNPQLDLDRLRRVLVVIVVDLVLLLFGLVELLVLPGFGVFLGVVVIVAVVIVALAVVVLLLDVWG